MTQLYMDGKPIYELSEKVFRGQHPVNALDLKSLKDLGVKTILNLERGFFEFFTAHFDYEVIHGTLMGMNVIQIQMSDFLPPSADMLDAALAILLRPESGRVYVHCMHGVDRTGFVCAAYRVHAQGWTQNRAIQEMYGMGFHKWSYFWWLPSLRRYLSRENDFF